MFRSGASFAPERVNAGFRRNPKPRVAEGDDSQGRLSAVSSSDLFYSFRSRPASSVVCRRLPRLEH